ncbi:aldehyde dehydrogenase (NAD+) [Pseudonocardia thermophila]|uniref:Aldehyde dehydrogenase (NAD+) n=1 Tax=Pseudonocardia thermophila TaxID=1848 RepID=A0A1M6PQ83_PSETH|nr:aldehyde dehydrogenase family protein [Pseudonocardia thermophila]SHK10031.1 aldehyde dehydrogenase (NAD+) [Pseudonocardia thermophila]
MTDFDLWVDGAPVPSGTAARFTRTNPYDGSVAATFADGDAADAERAITAARRAFDEGPWPRLPAKARHDVLIKASQLLAERTGELAERMVLESGKPVTLANGEVASSARTFDYYAGLALSVEGSAISDRNPSALGLILREPVGVAGLITAWNFPLLGIVCKLAPALAAGCTVVLKPSHLCPGPALVLARLLTEAGLPDGVFNVVTTQRDRGALVGQHLASSTAVDKIAFTGSTAAGRAVMRAAAVNTKRISLELGGKSANIVLSDADLEAAAKTAVGAFTFNSGQQCSAGSRLLLHRDIHDEFLDLLARYAGEQVLGDPRDPATTMGPLVSPEQHARVLGYIDLGRAEAKLVVGGNPGSGLFVEPTVFDEVDNSSRLAQEEVFGPVLSVIPVTSAEEAVAIANDSAYGLAGGVWTRSLDTAIKVVKGVRTGKMFVNSYNTAGIDDMPHGGVKDSGTGREFGLAGLEEYQEQKTVQILLR